MSQTTSATTGRRYGLERVCRLWEQSRSAFYARRDRLQRSASADSPCRRGPTPALSDAQLLAAIRNDLARSPFQGEGHRKVHARLRILDGVRVSRTRVLRVMRAQGLLSPHRGRQGEPKPHDGTIVTSAPDVMWGTDGARVLTVDDGWVWTFAAVDHWNAECVGWHVCKVGDRFAALEPVAQGLRRRCGLVEADAARGLSLRMDHGSQYLSDHFLNQVRYWGIRPSFGLLKEPETNGVVERWNRTLKEQAVYGRVSKSRRRARRRRRVRRALQPVLAPREAGLSHATRGPRRVRATPSRVAQTCVQETGCGTRRRTSSSAESIRRRAILSSAAASSASKRRRSAVKALRVAASPPARSSAWRTASCGCPSPRRSTATPRLRRGAVRARDQQK